MLVETAFNSGPKGIVPVDDVKWKMVSPTASGLFLSLAITKATAPSENPLISLVVLLLLLKKQPQASPTITVSSAIAESGIC